MSFGLQSRTIALSLVAFLIAPALATSARAGQCAPAAVSAHGEPATFQWLARTKARANWRAKVRHLKGLGAPFADWDRAENRTEDCTPSVRGIACTFAATPCRP